LLTGPLIELTPPATGHPLSPGPSVDPFNVRQLPALVEDRLFWAIEAKPREPVLPRRGVNAIRLLAFRRLRALTFRAGLAGPRTVGADYLRVEEPVNALLGLGHGLFLPQCQGTQSRSGKQGQVGARSIDAHTPLGPLPVRHNVISAISAGFRCSHLSGPR
jgi:hypothetical protein